MSFIFNKHVENTILQPCGLDLGPALLFSVSCLSLLSRLTPWCMRSSCCGWVEPRGKWTLTGYRCSPSRPKGACWPSQRAESHHPVMWEQSSSHNGGPQTKAGADNHQHCWNTQSALSTHRKYTAMTKQTLITRSWSFQHPDSRVIAQNIKINAGQAARKGDSCGVWVEYRAAKVIAFGVNVFKICPQESPGPRRPSLSTM